MEVLTASVLHTTHGFPTREGGSSTGAFTSLNTSYVVGDDPSAVRKNLEALAARAGVQVDRFRSVKQVHGDVVVNGDASTSETEADAVWTVTPGTSVGVRTADCLPILIHDPVTHAVAAVHAGWRGVIASITARAIETLIAQGARAADLEVAMGPCIQRCCFEVDGDLPERFRAAFGDDVVIAPPSSAHKVKLDLPLAVQKTLAQCGIQPSHVAALPQCTMCDARFFSHRRDRGITGRHLSFITCTGASAL